MQQAERPIEEIFVAGPAPDPVAVDIEVEVLGHPVRVVLRKEKSYGVRCRVSGFQIRKAAVICGVAVGENRLEAGQNILVVHILAVDGGVGCVIRVVFAGLQAVGHLTVRSCVSGCLEIDPDTGRVVRLEI